MKAFSYNILLSLWYRYIKRPLDDALPSSDF